MHESFISFVYNISSFSYIAYIIYTEKLLSISIEYIMHIHSSYHISIIYTLFIIIYIAHQIPYITHNYFISFIFIYIYILYTFVGGELLLQCPYICRLRLAAGGAPGTCSFRSRVVHREAGAFGLTARGQGPILVGQ